MEFGPGDVLMVDWAHVGKVQTAAGLRPLSVFCAVLGWSRYRSRSSRRARPSPLWPAVWPPASSTWMGPARVLFDNA